MAAYSKKLAVPPGLRAFSKDWKMYRRPRGKVVEGEAADDVVEGFGGGEGLDGAVVDGDLGAELTPFGVVVRNGARGGRQNRR